MKKIKKYLSEDNVEFDSKDDCIQHEFFIKNTINNFKKMMPKEIDDTYFDNGRGYIQWKEEDFINVKNLVLKAAYSVTNEDAFLKSIDVDHCRGIVGRYFDDMSCGNRKLSKLKSIWWRLMNIDKKYREWGQCYYALNPEKGEPIKLN